MDAFTRADLRRLISTQDDFCVSIYMPTHRTGREIREDSLRLKNLINRAEEQLKQSGMKAAAVRKMLQPVRELQSDGQFWRRQSDGLAVFAAQGGMHHYRLPLQFEELVVVNNRFHVKPVLTLLQNDGQFYVLAVSQNRVRLLKGSHYSVSELAPEGLPGSLADALNIDEYVRSLQQHGFTTMGVGGAGGRENIFHGHGGSDMEIKKKDELREFFCRIDDGLGEFFGTERSPLVFAGVDYLFPIFRDACSYRALVEKPVTGNPDDLKPQQLHQKAWSLVEPIFRREEEKALERFGAAAARNLASRGLDEVVAAARNGRVETLFVAKGERIWGLVNRETGEIRRVEQTQPGAEDLLDHAAVHTLLHDGGVYVLDRGRMPDGAAIAAIFRYAG